MYAVGVKEVRHLQRITRFVLLSHHVSGTSEDLLTHACAEHTPCRSAAHRIISVRLVCLATRQVKRYLLLGVLGRQGAARSLAGEACCCLLLPALVQPLLHRGRAGIARRNSPFVPSRCCRMRVVPPVNLCLQWTPWHLEFVLSRSSTVTWAHKKSLSSIRGMLMLTVWFVGAWRASLGEQGLGAKQDPKGWRIMTE
jgi:hypothetical protein